jgi:hypothetical protein
MAGGVTLTCTMSDAAKTHVVLANAHCCPE